MEIGKVKRGKRENLVLGRRKRRKDLIVLIIFIGSFNVEGFEGWLLIYLLLLLIIILVLIMDNVLIYWKIVIK